MKNMDWKTVLIVINTIMTVAIMILVLTKI